MNREQLLRALRRYAKKHNLQFFVSKARGKGSHYVVELDSHVTTVQDKLNPGRIDRILKQLRIEPGDL